MADLGGQAGADSLEAQAARDTTGPARVSPARALADSLRSWRDWPDISRAILLAPLDGPEDILEKREILQDRLDDLEDAAGRLDAALAPAAARHRALEAQVEVLEDLAEVQLGEDLTLDQRIQRVRGDLDEAAAALETLGREAAALAAARARIRRLADTYLERATQLRRREEESR